MVSQYNEAYENLTTDVDKGLINEMIASLTEIRLLSKMLEDRLQALSRVQSSTPKSDTLPKEAVKQKLYSLSLSGKAGEAKGLLQEYGTVKLSKLTEKDCEQILKKLETIK